MKDYVKAFQDKIAAIDADALRVNIINAGVMNHGKSSLFNSLLDKNLFPDKNGIDGLNKIKTLFPDEKFFAEHLCLVLTSIDDHSVRDKALADIKKFCGLSGFKVFFVSNTRYKKDVEKNKSALVKQSGILELRDYLQQNISKWRAENKTVRQNRIARKKDDLIVQLNKERSDVQERIQVQ